MIGKIGFVTLIGLLSISVAQANQMYRFKVDGRVVLHDHIPPQYSHLGYEVIGSNGMVIKVVPPAPTVEELAQRREQEAAQKAREAAIAKRRAADNDLLRLYSKPEDVDRALKRKADEVESQMQMQRMQLADLQKKLEEAQGAAANFERRGQEIPADLRLEIVQLQNGIRDNEQGIRNRQADLDEIIEDYSAQNERLRILKLYPAGTLREDVDIERVNRQVPR